MKDGQDREVMVAVGAKLDGQPQQMVNGSIEGLCAAIPGSLEIINGEVGTVDRIGAS